MRIQPQVQHGDCRWFIQLLLGMLTRGCRVYVGCTQDQSVVRAYMHTRPDEKQNLLSNLLLGSWCIGCAACMGLRHDDRQQMKTLSSDARAVWNVG